ncbi:uncharacterized protein LOC133902258 [Phragmites australis]|uniref:uncharacterized protein LOC133902258 n=1 Tax=Phragmites australis TaxID=29695 RepID=UPI002D789237|nr:uncharacterized protein LOC133902258 [Phragmites australis]
MRLSMFNEFTKLKFLAVAETRFASVIVMLKRFLLLKEALVLMVVGDKWMAYREDDPTKTQAVKEKILNDIWWDQVQYIVDFTDPIYSMLRAADTDKPCLHLVYEMWDSMIEKVRVCIYRKEGIVDGGTSVFFDVVQSILLSRWGKSNTPLQCLAHSLNPRYYNPAWLNEVSGRVSPNNDVEINTERNKYFRKFFPDPDDLRKIKTQFADSQKSNDYQSGPSRMWDVRGDGTESFVGVGFLEGADLTLDELEFEEILGEKD